MGEHASKRRPSFLSAVLLSAIVIALCAGVLGMVSMITHGNPSNVDSGGEIAPTPYSLNFESATPTVTVTDYAAAPQSLPKTTTVQSTVTARVTRTSVSVAPTVTVTASAPTVTECRVWNSNRAHWDVQDCSQSPQTGGIDAQQIP